MHSTRLTKEFGFEKFIDINGKEAIPLFAITPEGKVQICVIGREFKPSAGWTIVSLFTPSLVTERAASNTATS
jgi:hypothetical protein